MCKRAPIGINYDNANFCKIHKIYPYPDFLNATGMRRVLYARNYTHKLPRVFCEAAILERIAANLCSFRPLWVPVCTFIIRTYVLHFEKFQ